MHLWRILSESLQVHALEQDTGLAVRTCHRTVGQRGETQVTWAFEQRETKSLLCVADRDDHTWLGGESVLSAPARLQENFKESLVDVDLST